MQKPEFRVRPVVRHVVTRYTFAHSPEPGSVNGPSLETLGEFDSEQYAEQVAEAMRSKDAFRQYVAVERGFDVATNAVYFDHEYSAKAFADRALIEEGREFRIYSRPVTDPIARGRMEVEGCSDRELHTPIPPKLGQP